MTNQKIRETATRLLQKEWDEFSEMEKGIVRTIVEKRSITRNANEAFSDERTFGERIADHVAAFGGSWPFIIIFGSLLLVWVILNSLILVRYGDNFDPYPYILLNLFLSMLAAIQAPIIMMSQKRQAAKDRLDAAHDYEVNLKSELEIVRLHEKIDELRETKWSALIKLQQEQLDLLRDITKTR